MNDNIAKILVKAKSKVWNNGGGLLNDIAFEVVAEMIVRECVDCLEPLGQTSRVEARDTIQEHFGIY